MQAEYRKLLYSPHPYQFKVHEAMAAYRFVVAVAHRRFGKTECAIAALVCAAAACPRPHGSYGYIAPFLKQAKAIAWRKLKRAMHEAYGDNWSKNEAELWVELPNGARIQLFGADNADAIRGMYFDGIVIDEIADMKSDVWNGVIRPALADRKGWALMIGTPKGINELYRFYQRGLSDPLWKSLMFSISHTDLPWLPPEEVKALEEDMTDNMFRQEMLCDFQASSDDVLFKLDLLHASAQRKLKASDLMGASKVMGLDVGGAEKGSDRSVLTKKQGLMIWPQQVFKLDTPGLCDMLASQMNMWKPDAVIIDNGKGFAVVEMMQRRGFTNVFGVDFGGKPIESRYHNKKTEMTYRTYKALTNGLVIPNDPQLFEEMSVHTVHLNDRTGKIDVLDKPKVKEIIKRSPDKFDSLILCHAWDVVPLITHPLLDPERAGIVMPDPALYGGGKQIDFDPYNN